MYKILHIPTALMVCDSESSIHHISRNYVCTHDKENRISSTFYTNMYPILFYDKNEAIRYLEESWLYSIYNDKYIKIWHGNIQQDRNDKLHEFEIIEHV